MSEKNLGDRIIDTMMSVLNTLIPSSVHNGVNKVIDFAYVRVLGLPFIVLGYRATGKTSLLEWLKHDTAYLDSFDPDPTAAGGDSIPTFGSKIGDEYLRLKPRRDVGGEYAMWETDWLDLYKNAKPYGIIFLLDPSNPYQHKDALNFVLQMIDEEHEAGQNLRAFLLLANKSDLWNTDTTLGDFMDEYRNETRRLKSQAERMGYKTMIAAGSLKTGAGMNQTMTRFFNVIRPRPPKAS